MNERVGSSARLRAAASLLIVMLRLIFLRSFADAAERAQMAVRALLWLHGVHDCLPGDEAFRQLREGLAPMIDERWPVGRMIGPQPYMSRIGPDALADECPVTPPTIFHGPRSQHDVSETT